MKPRGLVSMGVLALLGVAVCGTTPARARRAAYERGEIVIVTGIVTDTAAEPIPDVEVIFKAARHSYDYLRFRRRTPVEREIHATTSNDGSFEIRWPWDGGFNRFELLFGLTVAKPGGEYFHVLHKEDLTSRIKHGSPVVSTVRIDDTGFVDSFRELRASLESEAQRRVYREAGKPDKVRQRVFLTHAEVDWWYFDLGKVYRFRDGELTEVENFEPLTPFDS